MDRKILYRFFNRTASFEEENAVCDWVYASEENRREFFKERKYFDVLLLNQNNKSSQSLQSHIPSSFTVILKIAAVIAVLLISFAIYNVATTSIDRTAYNKIIVPTGQRVNLVLPDGTIVWLNSRTELSYPAVFSEKQRIVTLSGEAYFEVTKKEEQPFVVRTSKCDIEVLGTKFNVEAYDDTYFQAALMEGIIKLTDNSNPERHILLSPKQKVEFRDGDFKVDSIYNYDKYRWNEGLLCFEDITFIDLMKEFEKNYDIKIIVQDKSLYDYKCSGKFRVSDGIDFILRILQQNADFTFYRNEDNTIIYID